MVFEFLRGKIDIILEKFSFSPGEMIKGKVLIDLKKPTRARQLKIGFYGLKIIKERVTDAKGNPTIRTRREFIHKFEMPLDGEKEYLKGEYHFEIKIPENIQKEPKKPKEGIFSILLRGAQILSQASGMTSRTEWYLETVLEIPMAFDMKKRASINIV
jgi:hypothetical protein